MSATRAVLLGLDTEADDQWSARGREEMSVRNAQRLPDLQRLCAEFGVRPSYLVTHEMASGDDSAAVLRGLHQEGGCEIGTHLHPWSSPPFRPQDLAGHAYPHTLPLDLLERQLTELTATIEERLGVRPTTYRAGRNGFDARSIPLLERLGYTVDTSVDPLFNERRKGGMVFAGAPRQPYRLSYDDARRPGSARLLEVPITAATLPGLPKPLEALYTRLPPLHFRAAFRRLGLRPVWLRPSYTALPDMIAFADRLAAGGASCFNIIFHSSELLPGGSPYTPDAASVERFHDALRRLLEHLTGPLGAVGLTYAELEKRWSAEEARATA